MPRWLSEGISVYEERQAQPTWGQRMNPRFRELILGGELTPVSKMSGAFLAPESNLHLQFAYYQSSLVVEHLTERFGLEAIRNILKDLGEGVEINAAIAKHTEPLNKLETAFRAYAVAKAKALAPGWTGPSPIRKPCGRAWRSSRRNIRRIFTSLCARPEALNDKDWEAVKAPCKELIKLFPPTNGEGNPYVMLAAPSASWRNIRLNAKHSRRLLPWPMMPTRYSNASRN